MQPFLTIIRHCVISQRTRSLQHDVGRSIMLGLGASRDYRDTEMSREIHGPHVKRYCEDFSGYKNNESLSGSFS